MVPTSAGLIAMGAYIPAKQIPERVFQPLVDFLKQSPGFPSEYIDMITSDGCFPGSIETNYDGWEKHPWFRAWIETLPEKKKETPFQGTKERRRVPSDPVSVKHSIYPHPMLPSDAETIAGAVALINSGLPKESIDLVLAHSQVPDRPLPANVSLIQHKLGLTHAGAYSVDSCCSSFVTMMELASSLVISGVKTHVLIVASYIDSHVNDKSDYFSVNTGDAAVAGIVSKMDDKKGYVASHSTSDGSRHDGIIFLRRTPGLFAHACSGPDFAGEYITFNNRYANKLTAENAEKEMAEVVDGALSKAGLSRNDIDFFVTHQPVSWAGNVWRQAIHVPENKWYESFETFGNTGTCSAAINLLEAVEKGFIKTNDTVVIASSGAGDNHIALIETISGNLIDNNHLKSTPDNCNPTDNIV